MYIHPLYDWLYQKKNPNPFYNKYYEIKEEINEPWTAIDLLYIRDSKQKQIEEIYKMINIEIYYSTIQLTLDIIKELQPKLVVVANRFVNPFFFNMRDSGWKAELDSNNIYRYEKIPS